MAPWALLLLVGGCQLIGRNGPASGELLNCRQLTQRGISAGERGDWTKAESLLGQAIKTCPVDCESRRHYAEALWHCNRGDEALVQMREAIRLSSDDPSLLVQAAEMQISLGQNAAALANVEAALDLDPKLARAWSLRGRVLQQAGQSRQALSDYHRSLSYRPNDREALLEIAELYRQLDEPQRALVTLHSLLDTYPAGEEPQQPLCLAALAYEALNRPDDAAETYRLALGRGQPTPEILHGLAKAEFARGRLPQAQAALEQALAMSPEHAPSRELAARVSATMQPLRR